MPGIIWVGMRFCGSCGWPLAHFSHENTSSSGLSSTERAEVSPRHAVTDKHDSVPLSNNDSFTMFLVMNVILCHIYLQEACSCVAGSSRDKRRSRICDKPSECWTALSHTRRTFLSHPSQLASMPLFLQNHRDFIEVLIVLYIYCKLLFFFSNSFSNNNLAL